MSILDTLDAAAAQIGGTFIDGLDRRIDAEFRVREPVLDPAANQQLTQDPSRPPVVSGRPNEAAPGVSSVLLIGGALLAVGLTVWLLKG